MSTQRPNVICLDRRKQQRRDIHGLQANTTGFEPNPFSRRSGIDRRDTMIIYADPKWGWQIQQALLQ